MQTTAFLCFTFFAELLWAAPEILRLPLSSGADAPMTADVYSFAIIVQEILFQAAPYFFDTFMIKPEGMGTINYGVFSSHWLENILYPH